MVDWIFHNKDSRTRWHERRLGDFDEGIMHNVIFSCMFIALDFYNYFTDNNWYCTLVYGNPISSKRTEEWDQPRNLLTYISSLHFL